MSPAERTRARVLAAVRTVPPGSVTTYGAVGKRLRVTARQAARVLATMTEDEALVTPWHRVVGAGGSVRTPGRRQADLLREEGVEVTPRGKVVDFAAVFVEPL